MPILENIDWNSIEAAPVTNKFANAVKYAERIAWKCECKMAAGQNFYEALQNSIEQAKEGDFEQDQWIKAVGLLYTAWRKRDLFAQWYKFRYGRDLNEDPTITRASPIMAERVERTKNRQLGSD